MPKTLVNIITDDDPIPAYLFIKEMYETGDRLMYISAKDTKIVMKREDWVNIYPLCTECYARITYIPDIRKKEPVKIAVI